MSEQTSKQALQRRIYIQLLFWAIGNRHANNVKKKTQIEEWMLRD